MSDVTKQTQTASVNGCTGIDIGCLPPTSGMPTSAPEKDQLPIAYDKDTKTTWYFMCDTQTWVPDTHNVYKLVQDPQNVRRYCFYQCDANGDKIVSTEQCFELIDTKYTMMFDPDDPAKICFYELDAQGQKILPAIFCFTQTDTKYRLRVDPTDPCRICLHVANPDGSVGAIVDCYTVPKPDLSCSLQTTPTECYEPTSRLIGKAPIGGCLIDMPAVKGKNQGITIDPARLLRTTIDCNGEICVEGPDVPELVEDCHIQWVHPFEFFRMPWTGAAANASFTQDFTFNIQTLITPLLKAGKTFDDVCAIDVRNYLEIDARAFSISSASASVDGALFDYVVDGNNPNPHSAGADGSDLQHVTFHGNDGYDEVQPVTTLRPTTWPSMTIRVAFDYEGGIWDRVEVVLGIVNIHYNTVTS